jgi:putative tricarboxylic transport membrane protein
MTESPLPPESQSSSGLPGGGGVSRGRWSDRALGAVGLCIAVLYTIEARTFDGTAFGSGPVGPKTLPTGVGVVFGAISLYLMVKADESPTWPTSQAWGQIAVVIASSYLYGQILSPVGFIVASMAIILVIGLLFRAPVRKLLPLSIVFPVVLAFIFNNWLELKLPAGWWGGF